MKYFFAALLSLMGLTSVGQCPFGVAQYINAYYEYKALRTRYILQLPRSLVASSCRDTAFVYYNPSDSLLHYWTGTNDLAIVGRANQGIFDSSGTVQLGELLNQSNNGARFYQKREVPLNGKPLYWWDTLNNSNSHAYTALNDTSTCSLIGTYKVNVKRQADTNQLASMWWEFRPPNYGYPYASYKPNGALATARSYTWGMSQNDAGGLTMPDNVYGGGYNIINATGRADTGDAACSMRLETSFIVFGEPVFEMHWPEITHFDGSMQRVHSLYMGKTDGRVLDENNLDDIVYKRAVGTVPGTNWIEMTSNSGEYPAIQMTGAFSHSIDGIIQMSDITGGSLQMRAIDGDYSLLMSPLGQQVLHIDQTNGNWQINYNTTGPTGTTTIGADDGGSYPAGVEHAQLAVVSVHRGFLQPTMTSTQINAIAAPPEGLTAYSTTVHQPFLWNGTEWSPNSIQHTLFAPLTGGTVNLVANNYAAIHPAAAIATLTINFPSSPNDNDYVEIKLTQTVATVTWGNGTASNPPTANVSGYLKFVYDQSTTTWY